MKDMTSVANTMLSEEEKAAAGEATNANANTNNSAPSTSTSTEPQPHLSAPFTAAAPASGSVSGSHLPSSSSDDAARPASLYAAPSPSTTPPAVPGPAGGSVSAPASPQTGHPKKRSKLTPEQREKLLAHERERKRALEARVRMLTEKLVERLRPFVEAKNPGAPGDAETAAWEERMRHEAEDLKVESFGVEILHTIGTVYVTKASGFLKSKRFLGM